MGRRARILAIIAALTIPWTGPTPPVARAAPLPYEMACSYARLYLFDMLLICDGAYAWCWSGWDYSSDEGGLAHYQCGGVN